MCKSFLNQTLASLLLVATSLWAELPRPNVLLILTDDQGYADLSFHGNPHLKTPYLDQLAAKSIRFTQFQASPTCSPTRAALLTGRHEFSAGITHTILGRSFLRDGIVTLPELFLRANYATGIFGKWHLGDTYPCRPQDRGFEEVFIHLGGGIGQTPDYWGNRYFDPQILHNGTWQRQAGYCTDVFVKETWNWIEGQKNRPWLAYLSLNAPHAPMQIKAEWARPYLAQGLPEQTAQFYGMIENMDQSLGWLLDQLEASNKNKNTLVVFMTDNGSAKGGVPRGNEYNAGLRGFKGSPYQGGIRVPCFFYWPQALGENREQSELAGMIDILPTLAELCKLDVDDIQGIEGRSLVPLLTAPPNSPWPDRTLITHVGRWPNGKPVDTFKYRNCSIRNQQYSLVNGKELYDLNEDPGERFDIADQYPEAREQLNAIYDAWWDRIQRSITTPQPIQIGSSESRHTELNCMDWSKSILHPKHSNLVLWKQEAVNAVTSGQTWKNTESTCGSWYLEFLEAGRYRFTLRNLPKHASNLPNAQFKPGKASLHVAGKVCEKAFKAPTKAIEFELDLEAGRGYLEGVITGQTKNGTPQGAYFVEVEHIEPAQQKPTSNTPQFSWDTVPLFAHLGKWEGPFDPEEIEFLAHSFPLIILEKTMEMKVDSIKAEAAIEKAARALKKENDRTTVLGYWNAFIAFDTYASYSEFDANHHQWAIRNLDGSLYLKRNRRYCYDLSIPGLREWWLSHAFRFLNDESPLDGLLVDALNAASHSTLAHKWGKEKCEAIERGLWDMLRTLDSQSDPNKFLAYNGAGARLHKWEDRGLRFLDSFDAVMLEHFAGCSTRDRKTGALHVERFFEDLDIIQQATTQKKTVLVKAWPRTKHCLNFEGDISENEARNDLEFALASFLLAAEKNCYFLYNWGYTNHDGQYIWYEEYSRPLGPPLSPYAADADGNLTREFEHASVWVNPYEEAAKIAWNKKTVESVFKN